jgi:hypothetical protein
MQRHCLAQAIDQFVQRATLTDDRNLEALPDVPAATAADHRMNGFTRRRVPVYRVACPRFGYRAPGRFRLGTAIRVADLVHPSRYSREVVQAVCVVRWCVDTATTHDVCEHRAPVEMRECLNDVARSKPPAAALATDPASRAENLFVDRHALNIHL